MRSVVLISLPPAISIWTASGDLDHVWIVGSYLHYTPGFTAPKARDICPPPSMFGMTSNPMNVVCATKCHEMVDMRAAGPASGTVKLLLYIYGTQL
jgi:hypothetical protein